MANAKKHYLLFSLVNMCFSSSARGLRDDVTLVSIHLSLSSNSMFQSLFISLDWNLISFLSLKSTFKHI